MLKLVRDNSLIVQSYVDFKRRYKVQELTIPDMISNGFKIAADDEQSQHFLSKSKLSELKIMNNFTEWQYQHIPPERDFPNFKFILGKNSYQGNGDEVSLE